MTDICPDCGIPNCGGGCAEVVRDGQLSRILPDEPPIIVLPHGYRLPELCLSDSSHNVGKKCWRKLEMAKFYGHLRNESDSSLAAEVGKCLHHAYQTYTVTRDKEEAIWAMISTYPTMLNQNPNDMRSMEACYSAFEEMIDSPLNARYQLAYIDVDGEKRPAVEVPFRITVKDASVFEDYFIPIYYDGFIDLIMWDTLEQKYIVIDIKTTRMKRDDYTAMFGNDPQCLPYAFVLDKALGQPSTSLDVLYFVVYVDALEPRVLQYPFTKNAHEIQRWAFNFAFDLQNIRHMAEIGLFHKNGKRCDDWGKCIYFEPCAYQHAEQITQYLDLKFGEPVWKKPDFDPWFTLDLTIQGLK